jgi:hypothetical protein
MNATKTGVNSGAPKGLAVPAPHVPPKEKEYITLLLFNKEKEYITLLLFNKEKEYITLLFY